MLPPTWSTLCRLMARHPLDAMEAWIMRRAPLFVVGSFFGRASSFLCYAATRANRLGLSQVAEPERQETVVVFPFASTAANTEHGIEADKGQVSLQLTCLTCKNLAKQLRSMHAIIKQAFSHYCIRMCGNPASKHPDPSNIKQQRSVCDYFESRASSFVAACRLSACLSSSASTSQHEVCMTGHKCKLLTC